MKKELRRWHLDCMAIHDAIMFESLIYQHNITSETVKSLTFEIEDEEDPQGKPKELLPMRGYFAVKEQDGCKKKYFVNEEFYGELPLRANDCEELYYKDSTKSKSIVHRPLKPTPFKITPMQKWNSCKEFIDQLLPFAHSMPEQWTLHKVMAVMGYVGKTFIGDCSKSEFGKSSIFEVLHSLTKKSPVFQPRSVPGVLAQITGDGNMVFDEVGNTNSKTRRCMENFTLQAGGNKPIYINGALQSKNTKGKYDIGEQSITFLYNTLDQYKTEDEFFENMFDNNKAIDSRLLKLKFDGILLEQFDKDFNMVVEAEKNKMFYIDIAKHLLYLKNLKRSNGYARRFGKHLMVPKLNGRKKRIYDELTWMIDMYSTDEIGFKKLIATLNECINSYQTMVGHSTIPEVQEELIVDLRSSLTKEDLLEYIRKQKTASIEDIEMFLGRDPEAWLKELNGNGDIFESRKGLWVMLE